MSRPRWDIVAEDFIAWGCWMVLLVPVFVGCAASAPPSGPTLLPGWTEAVTTDTMVVAGQQFEVREWSNGTDFVWFFRLLEDE